MAGVKGRSGRKPARRKYIPTKRADGFLNVNPRKSKRYNELYSRLYARLGPTIKETDEVSFNLLVQKLTSWMEAQEVLAADGNFDFDPKTGRKVPSAAWKVERGIFADLVQLCALFGLAPKFRSVLTLPQTDPVSEAKTVVDSFIDTDPGESI